MCKVHQQLGGRTAIERFLPEPEGVTLCCDLRKQEQLEDKCGRWREPHMQRSAACWPRAGGGGRQPGAAAGVPCKELGTRGCGVQGA